MRAKSGNIGNRKKTFIIMGLIVAALVLLQETSWNTYGSGSLARKISLSTEHVKGKVMTLGRVTKSILNTFD